ncbi:hypothetical protein OROGR_031399 [Orobanche gracilis]
MLDEALKMAEGRKIVEVEEKNQIIIDLEKEVNGLRNEVDCQGKSLIQLEGICEQIVIFCREDVELVSMIGKISHV